MYLHESIVISIFVGLWLLWGWFIPPVLANMWKVYWLGFPAEVCVLSSTHCLVLLHIGITLSCCSSGMTQCHHDVQHVRTADNIRYIIRLQFMIFIDIFIDFRTACCVQIYQCYHCHSLFLGVVNSDDQRSGVRTFGSRAPGGFWCSESWSPDFEAVRGLLRWHKVGEKHVLTTLNPNGKVLVAWWFYMILSGLCIIYRFINIAVDRCEYWAALEQLAACANLVLLPLHPCGMVCIVAGWQFFWENLSKKEAPGVFYKFLQNRGISQSKLFIIIFPHENGQTHAGSSPFSDGPIYGWTCAGWFRKIHSGVQARWKCKSPLSQGTTGVLTALYKIILDL